MNRSITARRRSRRTDARPALLWIGFTLALFAVLFAVVLWLRAAKGDWLELKIESARYRLIELLPEPERPEFVPTPLLAAANDGISPNQVSRQVAPPAVFPSPPPTARETLGAVIVAPETADTPAPTPTSTRASPASMPTHKPTRLPLPTPTAEPILGLNAIRPSVQLTGVTPEAQRFNNCGPTTLRMYLSYFGYTQDTQVQIADVLKPNKEDKNVGPEELVAYAQRKGFRALTRVNGNLDLVKQTLSNGLPLMIEEGYDPPRAKKGWMGHYLLITGYDAEGITAQDSYNGPNQRVSWQELDANWRHFNRTYLLLYTDAQDALVQTLLGEDLDDATMYAKAAQRAQEEWEANPQDAFAAFNLGSSLIGLGEYEAAAQAYDQARLLKLPWRMLWYQFGPYEAYYRVGRYQEVVALADATQKTVGDLEESYFYKGLALEKLGRGAEARDALLLALQHNPNYAAARRALQELGS